MSKVRKNYTRANIKQRLETLKQLSSDWAKRNGLTDVTVPKVRDVEDMIKDGRTKSEVVRDLKNDLDQIMLVLSDYNVETSNSDDTYKEDIILIDALRQLQAKIRVSIMKIETGW